MRALVYHGPGKMAWADVAKPEIINDTDAIVRVDATTIRGTDLHILKGDLPAVTNGRILGHEVIRSLTDGLGADVTIGGRGACHLRACRSAGSARRTDRQHRRARRPRDPASRRPVDQGHHHHDRPGHGQHAFHPLRTAAYAGAQTGSGRCWPTRRAACTRQGAGRPSAARPAGSLPPPPTRTPPRLVTAGPRCTTQSRSSSPSPVSR
jgi:hypothetical protein